MGVRIRNFIFSSFALAGCSAANTPGNDSLPAGTSGFAGFAGFFAGAPGSGGVIAPGLGGFMSTGGFGGGVPPVGGYSGLPQGGTAGIPPAGGAPSTGGVPAMNVCGKIFKECNGNTADGCETNVDSDWNNCGDCGHVCPPGPNAAPTCFVGKCDFSCAPHWGDCDGKPDNGCEDDLTTDKKNCGVCGLDCGDSACQNGGCQCASDSQEGHKTPLDIYVLFDQSFSMTENPGGGVKWDVIKGALSTFVQNQASAGISIGLGYFPFLVSNPPPICMADADCGTYAPCTGIIPFIGGVCQGADACYAGNYKVDVPIAILPGVSGAIVNSLNSHTPGGTTPTYAALAGTYPYVTNWAKAHPNDKTILVLATDGDPTLCDANNNVNTIASNLVAPALAGSPPVMTFVIGVGSSLTSLNQIAASGGTKQALIVDAAGADPGGQFLAAMKAIQTSVLIGCQYDVPTPTGGAPFDPMKVNVQFTSNGGSPQLIKNVPNAAACTPTDGGWYYDNPSVPTKILLCDSTCGSVNQGDSAKVEILLGCATIG